MLEVKVFGSDLDCLKYVRSPSIYLLFISPWGGFEERVPGRKKQHIPIQRGQLPPSSLRSREGSSRRKPKKFWQNSMEKQRTEQKKINRFAQDSNLSRVIHALKPLGYMRTILVLFCLVRYSILFYWVEWIFKPNTISCHHKIEFSNLYTSISLNHTFLLCQWRFSLRKKSTAKLLTIIQFLFFYVDYLFDREAK